MRDCWSRVTSQKQGHKRNSAHQIIHLLATFRPNPPLAYQFCKDGWTQRGLPGSYNFPPPPFPTTRQNTTGKFSNFPLSHFPTFPISELPSHRVLHSKHMFISWKRVPSRNVCSHGLSRGSNVTCQPKIYFIFPLSHLISHFPT